MSLHDRIATEHPHGLDPFVRPRLSGIRWQSVVRAMQQDGLVA